MCGLETFVDSVKLYLSCTDNILKDTQSQTSVIQNLCHVYCKSLNSLVDSVNSRENIFKYSLTKTKLDVFSVPIGLYEKSTIHLKHFY